MEVMHFSSVLLLFRFFFVLCIKMFGYTLLFSLHYEFRIVRLCILLVLCANLESLILWINFRGHWKGNNLLDFWGDQNPNLNKI